MTNFWPRGIGMIATKDSSNGEPKKTHHVWIEDQSGSMYWAVDTVAKDMCNHLKDISDGDLLTVGYFSGVGDFRWFVIGHQINNQADRDRIAKLIKDNARSRNTTCFSEILTDLKTVIENTRPLADSVNLAFLTDGHPVVPSYEAEKKAIFKAIESVKGDLSQVLIVGYGQGYNRELLAKMAAAFGGILQHADEIEQFGKELTQVVIGKGKKRVKIQLPNGANLAFSVGKNGAVTIYAVEDGKVDVNQGSVVYFTGATSQPTVEVPKTAVEDTYKVYYASALALNQQGKTDEALRHLSDLGDVALVNALANALTNTEIGEAEKKIQDAIADEKKRFLSGRHVGCLPKDDAFDLLDALALLQSDKDAKFYPFHEKFDYKRIGRKSVPNGDYPKFEMDKTQGVSFGNLVWSSDELNLSVQTQVKGTVTLKNPANAAQVGFAPVFPMTGFRNYALVANCYPNVKTLPVKAGTWETINTLMNYGVIDNDSVKSTDDIAILHLDRIPVCNRSKSARGYSAQEVATIAVKSTLLAGHINGLNSIRKELDPDKEAIKRTPFTAEQESVLNENGIFNGKYQPPMKEEPATDVMTVRKFEIKVSKFSSFPKLEDLRKQEKAGKFTPSGAAAWVGVKDFQDNAPKTGLVNQLQWIDARVSDLKSQRQALQHQINTARFAMALGNRWFTDLPSRNDTTVTVTVDKVDYTVTFDIGTIDKKI